MLDKVVPGDATSLVIAEDIDGEALATLVVEGELRGLFRCGGDQGASLRRPPQGHAAVTSPSSRVARSLRGTRPEARQRDDHRTCSAAPPRSSVTKDETTIVDGPGESDQIRVGSTRSGPRSRQQADCDYDREKLQERLAKLASGVAVIKAAATELKERERRMDNAKAAVEEDARRRRHGGPQRLREARPVGDEATGAADRRRALEEPLKQIAVNASLEGGVVGSSSAASQAGVRTPRPATMWTCSTASIIDPAKVTQSALREALRSRPVPHHRGRRGEAGEEPGPRRARRRRWHGLLIHTEVELAETAGVFPGPFVFPRLGQASLL